MTLHAHIAIDARNLDAWLCGLDAVAPLAANARSVISSSSEKPAESGPWSNAASTPSPRPR